MPCHATTLWCVIRTNDELRDKGVEETTCQSIQGFIAHAQRQLGQVERRLLRGEAIAHEEKVFSVFEEHTRWVSKGKAGTPVELGVPVALIEDQHQFILHHKILWEGEDVDVAAPMVSEAQARYPELRACSFDRGFHSPDNRIKLDALLDLNALPRKGYLSRADREREAEEPFARDTLGADCAAAQGAFPTTPWTPQTAPTATTGNIVRALYTRSRVGYRQPATTPMGGN